MIFVPWGGTICPKGWDKVSQGLGQTAKGKINNHLFCTSLEFHYLCTQNLYHSTIYEENYLITTVCWLGNNGFCPGLDHLQ